MVVCVRPAGHDGPHEGYDRRAAGGGRMVWTMFGALRPWRGE